MDSIQISFERLSVEVLLDYLLLTSKDFPDLNNNYSIENRAKKLSDFANFITCRTITGKLVGVIAFYMNDQKFCYITHVSIMDGYKHRGLCRNMLESIEKMVRKSAYLSIRMEVLKDNIVAIKSYQHCGFEIVADSSDNSYYMEKFI